MLRWARLVPALLVVACGSSPEPVQPTGIALDALAAALANADCERLVGCGGLSAPFDQGLCEERQTQLFYAPLVAALVAGSEANSLAYFELSAKDCREQIRNLSCEVGLDHPVLSLPGCASIVSGLGTAGSACPLPQACATGYFCAGPACPGTCQAFHTNNEACASDQPCASGLYCDLIGRRCLAVASQNQPCGLSMVGNSCAAGSYCDGTNPASPVCRPVKGRGQGCGGDDECLAGAQCIASRCSAGVAGDGCQSDPDCGDGLRCFGARCTAPLALGVACQQGGPPCVEASACNATCTALPQAGEPCPDSDCYLARCVAGTCRSFELDGGSCGAESDCLPGRDCRDQRCEPSLSCR